MESAAPEEDEYDVAVVGGGPAGCSASVFTARYGLDTVVFDRGRSSLRQCAFLENYLGFPAGIDVETLIELMQDHVVEAGCELIDELVTDVSRTAAGFRVETECGRSVSATRVVAATKYGAPYLESLDDDVLFSATADGDAGNGDARDLDSERVDPDGRTPVDGLYVAGPLAGVGDQTIIAAGHGAEAARTIVTEVRREHGYWDELAEHYDWIRRDAELSDEWRDRDRWHEWFDTHDEPDDLSSEEIDRLREEYIDARFERYLDDERIAERSRRGQRRIADHLDDEVLLEAIDDERLQEYARATISESSTAGETR